jgi:hypothetical protein
MRMDDKNKEGWIPEEEVIEGEKTGDEMEDQEKTSGKAPDGPALPDPGEKTNKSQDEGKVYDL